MFLIVRTKNQLNKTERFFKKESITVEKFAISSTVFHKVEIKPEDDGFIVTSPNAVLAIPQTKLPFFCVGEATEAELKETGRRAVYAGKNGAESMAKDIAKMYPPQKLVHAAGDMAVDDWYGILNDAGIQVEKRIAYETKYASSLDNSTLKTLKNPDLKAIVVFSVQGAITLAKLLVEGGLNKADFNVIAFSDAVEGVCEGYKQVLVVNSPTLDHVKNVMMTL